MKERIIQTNGQLARLMILMFLLSGLIGCASLRLEDDDPGGDTLPWNSPASWEGQMPMGAPY